MDLFIPDGRGVGSLELDEPLDLSEVVRQTGPRRCVRGGSRSQARAPRSAVANRMLEETDKMIPIGVQLSEMFSAYASGALSPEHYVRWLYRALLRRDVDPMSLEEYLAQPGLAGLARGIMTSHEFISRWHSRSVAGFADSARKQVLLFGAYGNGNLGDRMQAGVLRRLIGALRPDIDLWACSVLAGTFDFPFDRILPASDLDDPALLNRFDMMIVGGGGLLAHPHDPLIHDAWQRSLDLPVALLGIGAREPVFGRSETLVRRAFHVSGRDRTSIELLSRFRADVAFVPDPVLCDPALERSGAIRAPVERVLWILQADLIDRYEGLLAAIDVERDAVCFLEPQLDAVLLLRWPRAIAVYDAAQLVALVDAADAVASMRYHGTLAAILREAPVYAVGHDKSKELLERHGADAAFSPDGADFARDRSFTLVPQRQMRRERSLFMAGLSDVLDRV